MLTLFLMSVMAIAGATYLGTLMFQQHQQQKRLKLQPIRIDERSNRRY